MPCLSVLSVCNQIFEWIKMSLGTELCFGPGDIVLDGDWGPFGDRDLPTRLPLGKGYTVHRTAPPTFRPMSIVAKRSPISATAELL